MSTGEVLRTALLLTALLNVQAQPEAKALRQVSRAGRELLKVWLDLVEGEPEKLSPLLDSLPPSISESCIHAVEEVFRNDSHTFIRMLDAWGKPSGGILNGNTMWLGSYDECARLQDASFCDLKLLLGTGQGIWSGVFTEEVAIFSTAMCVPVECDGKDVKNAVDAVVLGRLDSVGPTDIPIRSEVKCDNFASEPLSRGAIVVIFLCCLMVTAVALATLCDAVFRVYEHRALTVDDKHLNVYTVTEQVLFNVLSRLTWGIALAFVVYACHSGYGGWLNSGLSWSFWTPLARLCFVTFLIHPIVLFATIQSLQRTLHCTYVSISVLMVGELTLSFGIAFAVSALVEYPLKGVLKAIFRCFGVERRYQPFSRPPEANAVLLAN